MKSRRDFLKKAGGAVIGAAVAPSLPVDRHAEVKKAVKDAVIQPGVNSQIFDEINPGFVASEYVREAAIHLRKHYDAVILEDLKTKLKND